MAQALAAVPPTATIPTIADLRKVKDWKQLVEMSPSLAEDQRVLYGLVAPEDLRKKGMEQAQHEEVDENTKFSFHPVKVVAKEVDILMHLREPLKSLIVDYVSRLLNLALVESLSIPEIAQVVSNVRRAVTLGKTEVALKELEDIVDYYCNSIACTEKVLGKVQAKIVELFAAVKARESTTTAPASPPEPEKKSEERT
jgi:hypothetical protein